MWLSGRQTPDFRTISDFRKDRLGDIRKLFEQVVAICLNHSGALKFALIF